MGWMIPVCDNCGGQYPLEIIIHDHLWAAVRLPEKRRGGVLCPVCIEARLGRKLTIADLKPCYITDLLLLGVAIGLMKPLPAFKSESASGQGHAVVREEEDDGK